MKKDKKIPKTAETSEAARSFMKTHKSPSGFTLIEILIAIFIFSIIVTTIFGSFTSVFSGAKMIDEDIDAYEMAKNCFDRMILDLRSLHISSELNHIRPGAGTDNPPDPYRIVGDISYAETGSFSRLRFTSQTHLPLEKSTQSGIAEIVYYVQNTDDDSYVLRRADSLYPYERFEGKLFEEKKTDPVLCENIKSLEIKYYDDEETEYDHWDSESQEFKYATPRAIRIKLAFGDESASLLFETMVGLLVYRDKAE